MRTGYQVVLCYGGPGTGKQPLVRGAARWPCSSRPDTRSVFNTDGHQLGRPVPLTCPQWCCCAEGTGHSSRCGEQEPGPRSRDPTPPLRVHSASSPHLQLLVISGPTSGGPGEHGLEQCFSQCCVQEHRPWREKTRCPLSHFPIPTEYVM